MKSIVKVITTVAVLLTSVMTANAQMATILSTTGKVEIKDGSSWIALKVGDTVEKGDIISTGYKSEAVIKIKSSELKLGPLTRMTVEDLVSSSKKDNTQIFIDSGSISAEVNSEPGKKVGFKVRSPVATASVRGTGLKVNSIGEAAVTHGSIAVEATDVAEAKVATKEESNSNLEDTFPTGVKELMGKLLVSKGQKTKVDLVTGKQKPPIEQKIEKSIVTTSTCKTNSEQEAKTLAAQTTVNTAASSAASNEAYGNLNINITFQD